MTRRSAILTGMAAGMVWSVAILWGAARYVQIPVFALLPTIMTAFLAPGIAMLLMVARLAQRRFFDDEIIDGDRLQGGAEIDRRVLQNTVEQLVLALCIWPAAAVLLAGDGPGVILVLGFSFAFTRLLFWAGYHRSPPLRSFGFAAGFYPTALVAFWSLWKLATGFG